MRLGTFLGAAGGFLFAYQRSSCEYFDEPSYTLIC